MKFTLSWLKRHLQTDASLNEITDALTRVGLEVESVTDRAAALKRFVSAHVVEARQHPNADRLRVCIVDAGSGPIQVVCGAPNARTGMKAVFAAAGTVIPGTGLELKVGQIRGEASNGMLVSEREMGLSGEHDGIIELPADAPLGVPFAELLGLDDAVIEIAVTPNRPDCLGIGGIARDLAAAGIGTLVDPPATLVLGAFACPTRVRIEADDLCPAFALRLIRGVKNRPSPAWMQRWLRAVGLRPINALVDVTNFLTYDRNRPLHVFDAAKVTGDLTVRRARVGETLLALDGRTYTLDDTMCVIADESGVESLAGIMGGELSGCSDETTDVLVESALWNPLNVAQTGRRLGVFSDARFRFERGVDPDGAVPGLERATRLILELCGGEPSEVVVAGEIPQARRPIDFPLAEVRRLTGLDVPADDALAILRRLGFAVTGSGETVEVVPPSWRPDVEGKADLVEEVMRIVGVDAVQPAPLPRLGAVARTVLTPAQRRTRGAKRALAARGLLEAVTWSFVPKAEAQAFGGGSPALELANPIASDLSDMRPSLLPGLLAAAARNGKRGFRDVGLFEVGQIFASDRPDGQSTAAAALRTGTAGLGGGGRDWQAPGKAVDVFDAKADIMALVAALGFPAGNVQVTAGGPDYLHPGRSGTLRLGANVLGCFGEVHPRIRALFDIAGPVAVFELVLDRLPLPKGKATRTKPPLVLSDLQPVTRDFAFVADAGVASGDIVRAAQGADRKLVSRAAVFDVYRGPGIEAGKISVAVEVTLQPAERTLTDAEIDAVAARIVAAVGKATGAVLRS